MEQTTSTTTASVTPALTAVVGALAVTTSAPEAGAETDSTAQFSALLDAIQGGAAPAPAAEAPPATAPATGEEEHAETSDADADAATPAPTAATATIAVTAAMLAPAMAALVAVPVPVSATTRSTKPGEGETSPVITDGVVPGDAPGTAPGPVVTAAPVTAAPATGPVAQVTLPSSPALSDGDVDPALVQAAIAAAAESAPAKPAAAPAPAKTAAKTATTATNVTAAAPETAEPQATAATPEAEAKAAAPAAAPAETAAREGGAAAANGHGGRLDLQVQATAPARPATTEATVETPVQIIDRERVERLAEGLAARLKVSHAADGARIRMQLEPRELGEVVVRLEIRNGLAHAHLIAESADASSALQASLADLRSSLADRGLQLESVSIRVAGEGASNAREQAAQSQGDRRHRAPLSFGRIDQAGIAAATDQLDRAREGQAVWMLA